VIDHEGEQAGVMSRDEAIGLAEQSGLDLVEVSPNAEPPVCRIMDFGKYLFEQKKKLHQGKTKQRQTHIKEVKFRPGTEIGDYNVKMRNLIRFLTAGDKRVEADLSEYGTVEQFPKMEGRQLVMVLAPKKK
jgi:translation initiation factor IF-3